MSIAVLRLGHRLVRDDRTTTHVALVSRAFGCKKVFMSDVDDSILKTVKKLCDDWGGSEEFNIEIIQNWKSVINTWKQNKGIVIHLTMYGVNIENISLDFGFKKYINCYRGKQSSKRSLHLGRHEHCRRKSTTFRNRSVSNIFRSILSRKGIDFYISERKNVNNSVFQWQKS